ncbi:MAG: 16S rRNA (guanine(527)-N(7))-methyltransferase RsmG [Patescibacteria group bacterium]
MSSLQFSKDQESKLQELLRVFLEENKKLNLSAYRTGEQCWVGNILDSIACLDILRRVSTRHDTINIIDVGTGGGFPLLPLAILFPEASFTGLDATKKKIDAVQRMVNHLSLSNVQLLIGRAEELGHDPKHREQYDLVLSRALAELPTLLEFMSPFCKVKGQMLCWKSLAIDAELLASLEARMKLHCRMVDHHEYDLDFLVGEIGLPTSCGGWGRRQILVFEKVKALSKEFPRRTGIPKKEPL